MFETRNPWNHSLRKLATCLVLAAASALLAAVPAHAVTRTDAANTVINDIILLHPRAAQMIAFGPQSTVPAGTQVLDGYDGRAAAIAPSTCWMFWLDPDPESKHGHATLLVFVDEGTGSIVQQADTQFWPRIGLTSYYANSDERTSLNPDLIYMGPNSPIPGPSEDTGRLRFDLPRILVPDPAAGKWALVISGSGTAANSDEKADVDSAKAIFTSVLGVPDGNITTLDNPTKQQVCDAIDAMPKKCPKMYVYVTAHGLPGRFFTGPDSIKADEWAGKLKELMAGEYCVIMAQCYSGSFLDALRDSTITGMHITSASPETTTFARTRASAKYPWHGEVFTHYWAECIRAGSRGTAAYQCARDSVSAYVARRNKQGAALHNPTPGTSTAFRDTVPGQATAFDVPTGTGSVCINWKRGNPGECGNATLYCQVVNGPDTTWKLVKQWNWNLGQTRYFSPNAPGATGSYRLVSHANGYPDCGDIRFPSTVFPETPTSNSVFPGYSVGWGDIATLEFEPVPFMNPGNYAPGLELDNVSRYIGVVGTQPSNFAFQYPLFVDPDRLWLYNNEDPLLGFNGQTTLEIHATGIFDPFGFPITSLPLRVVFHQPPVFQTFNTFAQQTPTGVVIPPVQINLRPQPFQIVVEGNPSLSALHQTADRESGSGPGPGGYIELDAVVVNTVIFGTPPTAVPPVAGGFLELSLPRPNPFAASTEFALTLPRESKVHVGVFDLSGRAVATLAAGRYAAGQHTLRWEGRDADHAVAPAGVYFIDVTTDVGRFVRRVVRLQ